jgi:hypothetical protein
MTVRNFPEIRKSPKKRILLIPVLLIFGGLFLLYMHPIWSTGFLGIIVSLTGALTVFLVGMIFADLWAASRRTRKIIEERKIQTPSESELSYDNDPFEESIGSLEDDEY